MTGSHRAWSLPLLVAATLVGLRARAGSQNRPPEVFERLSRQAAQAQREGQSRPAVSLYLRALEIRPKWADGWRNAGVLLAELKDYRRAAEAFKNYLSLEPKNGAGWALLGLSEYELGDDDGAYRDLERGRALGVGNADLRNVATYHAALILISKGEFEVARSRLVEIVRAGVDEDDADVVAAFGLAALRWPLKPERLDPAQQDLAMRVGRIEFQAAQNKVPEVIAAYRQLISERPKTPGLHYAFGSFLIGAEHYEDGIEQMRQELALDPGNVMAWLQTSMTQVKLGRPQDGIEPARHAAQLAPKLFVAHYALGWALFKSNQVEQAIPELELAAQLAPDSPQIHYALSEAYLRAHRRQDAYRQRAIFAHLKQQQATAIQSAVSRATGASGSAAGPQSGGAGTAGGAIRKAQ